MPFYVNTNRAGIPLVESNGVDVGTDKVIIKFANHAFRFTPYVGYVTIKITSPIPDTTDSTLPVVFETNGATIPLKNEKGDIAKVAQVGTVFVKYLTIFYNRSDNTLQLI